MVEEILKENEISVGRACVIVCLTRSMYYYSNKKDDQQVILKLSELSEKYPTRGFDTYYGKIRLEGLEWNRKRVLRVYRKLNLKMRRKRKRRLPSRIKEPLIVPGLLNDTWSIDFMSDALENGRKFRVLNIMDDCNREALFNEASFSIPAERLVDALKRLFSYREKPKKIRVDNGPEFISKVFVNFCELHQIQICYIQPGKPTQNAYIERFNRTFREDVLDAYLFQSIQEVNLQAYQWQIDYNSNHPHQALKGQSPWLFMNTKNVLAGRAG